jgi:hypothetical protein
VRLIHHEFGDNNFSMGGLLFDKSKENIHSFCKLLKNEKHLGVKYCPYLKNPLSEAGCYLTRGVKDDSTKRKEISNSLNSLDALGFIDRQDNKMKITELGKLFSETDFETTEWLEIVKKAICNYGLAVGLLWQIKNQETENIDSGALIVGYPNANENIKQVNQTVEISGGSQTDSNTRTKSCLLAWFTTAGFIIPNSLSDIKDPQKAHIETNEYVINKNTRNESHKRIFIPDIFNGNFLVSKPLNYDNLIKNIRALRENGQKASRELTMKYESIIKNRRLAILYCLNTAARNKKMLDFENLKSELKKYKEFFVIDIEKNDEAMDTELQIAFVSGIPFEVKQNGLLKPLTMLDDSVLCYGAPKNVIDLLNEKIIKEYGMSIFK